MAAGSNHQYAGALHPSFVQLKHLRHHRAALLALAAAAAIPALASSASAQVAKPIGMNGWNVEDLYNVTPAAGASFVPFDDDFGYTWYAAGAPNPQGLPTANNRTFTSASNGNTTFQFQPYDGTNNALELDSNGPGHMNQTLSQTL